MTASNQESKPDEHRYHQTDRGAGRAKPRANGVLRTHPIAVAHRVDIGLKPGEVIADLLY